jgi:hypothetical protein
MTLISYGWMFPFEVGDAGLPAYSDDGVDLTLIRWMLSLSPAERLEALQQFADFILIARGRGTSIPQPDRDAESSRG